MTRQSLQKIELRAEHYYLRTLLEEDASEKYLNWLHDLEVNRFLEVRFVNETMAGLRGWIAEFDNKNKFLFGIYAADTDVQIGTATLYDINYRHGRCDYGYLIGDRNYWGKNVIKEVVPLLFDYAFQELGLRKIITGTYANHVSSIINYKKCGLKLEARLKDHLCIEGQVVDEVLYSIFKEDWLKKIK